MPERQRLGDSVRTAQHVRQAQHADGGGEDQQRSAQNKNRGEELSHDRERIGVEAGGLRSRRAPARSRSCVRFR